VRGTDGAVEIKRTAEGEGWEKAKEKDIVLVKLTVATADGTVLGAVGGDEPAELSLDGGTIPGCGFDGAPAALPKGLVVALRDMKKGAAAVVLIKPGEQGLASQPDTGLKVTVELSEIIEVKDMTYDANQPDSVVGGVVMKIVEKGTDWKKPKQGDVVFLKYRVTTVDGELFDGQESPGDEPSKHTLGDASLIGAIEVAVPEMKKGGKVELAIQPDYSPAIKVDGTGSAPTELRASIELDSWYNVEDVSTDSSRGVLMTKVVEAADSNDYKMPKDMGTAKLHFELSTTDGKVLVPRTEEPISHQIDEDAIICPAIEAALKKMKTGGVSELRIAARCGFGELGNRELGVAPETEGNKLQLTAKIELLSFENEKDCWDLSEEEKLSVAASKKEDGNAKFKAGDIARAMRRYEAAKACLASDYKMDDKQKEQCKAAKVILFTNLAMCAAKLGKQDDVLKHSEEALKLDEKCFKVPASAHAHPMSLLVAGPSEDLHSLFFSETAVRSQALHRRGGIRLRANDFDNAESDLTQALEYGAANETFCKGVLKELALLKKKKKSQVRRLFIARCFALLTYGDRGRTPRIKR
jgi:FKBP-type peptidyl-prolyl cis-trans isomerase 2